MGTVLFGAHKNEVQIRDFTLQQSSRRNESLVVLVLPELGRIKEKLQGKRIARAEGFGIPDRPDISSRHKGKNVNAIGV